ncbi:MAG TPA: FAD-dependent thymidylate synthase [Acidimicrobiia bacterium]|nr:FAD-dependent thymidylate synthase [Acidimicrobiia bacterium]
MLYASETFTTGEAEILERYFTNLDRPVFALVNLPEVVKGALFARYSRTHKSLRRLFLDEFADEIDAEGHDAGPGGSGVGLSRAEALYDKVFLEYGDDSVAQLGGVHLACEQASNVLTKVLEWGRLMAYLEQSTRYIAYDARLDGRYRYWRDPSVLDSPLGARYVGEMDALFDAYAAALPKVMDWARERFPKEPGDSDFVWRQTVKAKACDAVRGMLPAASLSNVGIFGTGQAYEALLLRMRAHPLPEVRRYAQMILEELRQVIPSFLKRVDREDRGVAWTAYLGERRAMTEAMAAHLLGDEEPEPRPAVTLVDWDPEGEDKVLAAILYSASDLPEDQLFARVRKLAPEERFALLDAYVGERGNRRHKPGRAFERVSYRFDVLADYGAFRDLQRHRMLTIEWQPLSTRHGYEMPQAVAEAGVTGLFEEAMERSAALHDALADPFPAQAGYAVALAYRVRFVMQMNAREAMHVLELRTAPQGHPAYRAVCQEMWRLIRDQAGHHGLAEAMRHIDLDDHELGRLAAERRADSRRGVGSPPP